MKKEHIGYVLVERTQRGMLFFKDAERNRKYLKKMSINFFFILINCMIGLLI